MSLFRSLLLVIADSTQRELTQQLRYLKVENEILRSSGWLGCEADRRRRETGPRRWFESP